MAEAPTSRRIATIAALCGTVIAVALLALAGGGSSGHQVYVTLPDATNVIAGQEVRAAGRKVGSISSMQPVRGGRAVRLGLRIDDGSWPLEQGSRFALRWGGTISYSNRYITLRRGPAGAPPIADGATLPASSFTLPVEFDQLVGAFTPPVRRGLKSFLRRGGDALATARPDLRRALAEAPPAVTEASAVVRDLASDQRALTTLVRSSGSVVDAVHAADPGIGRLMSGAATTFDATAREATALRATLRRAPQTLTAARRTLAQADGTLSAAADLAERIAPGVTQLRRIASPLNSVLGTVVRVGPDARATLSTARRATPDIDPLLSRATQLMPQLGSIGRQSVGQLKCIRPYTPDAVAFFTNWADFLSATDGKDKYIRANVQLLTPAPYNAITGNSADIAKAFPGLRYAFPRPPGLNAGQPWFLPECGAGKDSLDPSKDPEAR